MNEATWRLLILVFVVVTVSIRCLHRWWYRTTYVKSKPIEETRRDWFLYGLAVIFGGILTPQLLGAEILAFGLDPATDTVIRSFGLAFGVLAGIGTLWPQFVRRHTWSSPITSPERIQNHRLTTWGPYKYVRHPFYAACILGALAVELTLASALAFVLPPLLMLIIAIVVRKEERQLEAVYGDQFRAYQARTGCLIPRIN